MFDFSFNNPNIPIVIAVIVVAIWLVRSLILKNARSEKKTILLSNTSSGSSIANIQPDVSNVSANDSKSKGSGSKLKKREHLAPLPNLITSFNPHNHQVTSAAFSPSGEFIAYTTSDRSIIVVATEHFTKSTHQIKFPTTDWATAAVFTSDSHHLLTALAYSREIVAYQITVSKSPSFQLKLREVHKFPTNFQKDISFLDVTRSSKYILTATDDVTIHIWSLKGKLLESLNTAQVRVNNITFAPNSKYLSVASWVPDVRIWEIVENKQGEFERLQKILELKGHRAQINCVCFNEETKSVATTCKDGSFKIWNIDVKKVGNLRDEAKCLITGNISEPNSQFNLVSFSPDSNFLLLTNKDKPIFYLYSAENGNRLSTIEDYPSEKPAFAISWSKDSQMFLSYTDTGIKIWKNPSNTM